MNLFIVLACAGMVCGKSSKSAKSSKSDGNHYTIIHHVENVKSAKSAKSGKKSVAKSPKSATSSNTKRPTSLTKSPTKKTNSPTKPKCPIKPSVIKTYLCPHWVTCPNEAVFEAIKSTENAQEIIIGASLEEGLQIRPGDFLPALGDTVFYLWAGADGKVNISWGSNDCIQDAFQNPRIVLFQTSLSAGAGTEIFASHSFDSYILSFESLVLAGFVTDITFEFQIEFFENGDIHFCYGPLKLGADVFFQAGLGIEFPIAGYMTEVAMAIFPAFGIGGGIDGGIGGYISLIPDGACHCLSFQCSANGN